MSITDTKLQQADLKDLKPYTNYTVTMQTTNEVRLVGDKVCGNDGKPGSPSEPKYFRTCPAGKTACYK